VQRRGQDEGKRGRMAQVDRRWTVDATVGETEAEDEEAGCVRCLGQEGTGVAGAVGGGG
jgi:hypothetical protein